MSTIIFKHVEGKYRKLQLSSIILSIICILSILIITFAGLLDPDKLVATLCFFSLVICYIKNPSQLYLRVRNKYFIIPYIIFFICLLYDYFYLASRKHNSIYEIAAYFILIDIAYHFFRMETLLFIIKVFCICTFLFSVFTLQEGGYLFVTASNGVLSAYLFLISFFISHKFKENILFKVIHFLSFSALFLIQIRMTILSSIVFLLLSSKISIKLVIALCVIGVSIFLYDPDSRIFASHASGRTEIWEKVIEYDIENNKVFFGHGSGFTKKILDSYDLLGDFGAMHNEYLHYFIDLGIIGGIIPILTIFLYFLKENSRVGRVLTLAFALEMGTDNVLTHFASYSMFYFILIIVHKRLHLSQSN